MRQNAISGQRRRKWENSEAPRLLFETLFGDLKTPGGLVGDALTYRGVNLPRLYEGPWITLAWPQWFRELADLDELAAGRTGTVVCGGGADAVRRQAAQCVARRHPGVKIEFQSSPPLKRRLYDRFRGGGPARWFSLAKTFRHYARRRDAQVGKTANLAFFPWSAKIAPNILPAAEAAAREKTNVCIAGWEAAPPFPLDDRWQWDTPAGARSPQILREAWRAGTVLYRRWKTLLREGRLDELGQWHGWDLRPLAMPFLGNAVSRLYGTIADVLTAEQWCRRRRLRGIVVPQDGGAGVRSLIAGAGLAGTRSFSVQYGYPTDTPEISEPMEDLALLAGESTRRCFLRRGASPEKLAVVGSTAYDRVIRLRSERAPLRDDLAKRYRLDPARPWLVAATWHVQAVYSQATKEAEMALVAEAAGRLPRLQVLFKLHPSDQGQGRIESAMAERFGVDWRIVDDVAHNDALLCAADAVVCNYTTLAIMAIMAQTPVMIVDVAGNHKAPDRPYVDEGVAEFADTAAAAETVLRSMLEDGRNAYWERRRDNWRQFIVNRLHSDDGQAASRMLAAINRELNADRPSPKNMM